MTKKITFFLTFCFAFSQFIAAQTFFSDDFSDLDISDWTLHDVDGDSYNWQVQDWSAVGPNIAEFDHVLVSRSWIGGGVGGLNPDNYAVSSAIDLTSAGAGLQLQYAYGTIEAAPYHVEEYSVYVTTSNSLVDIQAATAIHNEILSVPSSRQTNTIDLSAYAGQIVYLTFRHHNTFDENTMIIDDVVIRIPVDTDAIVESVSLPRYSLVSTDNQLSLDVTNNGSIAITSLEVNWNDGTDHISTIPTNIAPGATVTVNHPTMINYATAQEKDINVTVSLVNGIADESPSDNSSNAKFNTLSQSGTKVVLIEEATGTWCPWCPRGAVGMDYMYDNYPNTTALVAVHNNDPMAVTEYDNGIGQYIGGYPSGVVDRFIEDVNPAQNFLEAAHNTQINNLVPVNLTVGATQTGSTLTITANATFYTNFAQAGNNFRLGVIMTEDGVTGTGSGYNQANNYSGGGNGVMGGYENLPNPVPAAQMVYDHVGRALLGGFNGEAGSVPTSVTDGQTISHNFTYNIPATSDANNMHIIVVLIDQDNGSVAGAFESSVPQALSTQEVSGIDSIKIYPNPAKDILNIAFGAGNGDYTVKVSDMLGRAVITQSYTGIFGNQNIELPVSQLNAGHYIMTINNGSASYSSKFVVGK